MAKRKSFPRLEGKEEEEKKVGGKEFRTDGKIGRQKQQEGWARIAWSSCCPHLRLASVQDNCFNTDTAVLSRQSGLCSTVFQLAERKLREKPKERRRRVPVDKQGPTFTGHPRHPSGSTPDA